ncbi:helix-turn-helix domain-containing protein [Nocardia sp. NPDC059177]|uniref:helix-turn-helix domain-containing protein n=1 Tax=Nocardia sp. NPDC059177 TaxID=3346759 RepID=UPI0036BE687B
MDSSEVIVGGPAVSTDHVPASEAFAVWSALMSESVAPCAADRIVDEPFRAVLTPYITAKPMTITMMEATTNVTRRRPHHVARSGADTLIAGLILNGSIDVSAGGLDLHAPAGAMYLGDGSRAQRCHMTDFKCLLISVPRDRVIAASGVDESRFPAAIKIDSTGHGRLISTFFRNLITLPAQSLQSVALFDAGIELLGAGIALTSQQRPAEQATLALEREAVITFLHENLADPRLDAEAISRACQLSRRKLFRLLSDIDGGPIALLRRLRIERACELLIAAPERTVESVARACGFTGTRNFYRLFRDQTGFTPAEYREHALPRPLASPARSGRHVLR